MLPESSNDWLTILRELDPRKGIDVRCALDLWFDFHLLLALSYIIHMPASDNDSIKASREPEYRAVVRLRRRITSAREVLAIAAECRGLDSTKITVTLYQYYTRLIQRITWEHVQEAHKQHEGQLTMRESILCCDLEPDDLCDLLNKSPDTGKPSQEELKRFKESELLLQRLSTKLRAEEMDIVPEAHKRAECVLISRGNGPILSEDQLSLLRYLSQQSTALKKHSLEKGVARSAKTVSKCLRQLRHLGFTKLFDGARSGEVITEKGRQYLAELPDA